MDSSFIEIGKITGAHGIRGEVRVFAYSDSADGLRDFDRLFLADGSDVLIDGFKIARSMPVLKLRGVDSLEAAQAMRGTRLFTRRSDLAPLPKGVYYVADLIGLRVLRSDKGDEQLGILSDVLQTGANDVYEVKRTGAKPVYIPAIPDVIDEVNIEAGYIKITPLKGLIDDED